MAGSDFDPVHQATHSNLGNQKPVKGFKNVAVAHQPDVVVSIVHDEGTGESGEPGYEATQISRHPCMQRTRHINALNETETRVASFRRHFGN
ncbi:hypothetical protein E2C01_008206 [Portunus trituberculatus]|uniref:Uncharacterized protein n=1 Tax=Portunus trituberculatus TaxID=210409 RepID=A0A5B7D267_PORTR|nr:hypothetical protein [Portunus trituberculatus]